MRRSAQVTPPTRGFEEGSARRRVKFGGAELRHAAVQAAVSLVELRRVQRSKVALGTRRPLARYRSRRPDTIVLLERRRMFIRYGFDIKIQFAGPTTLITLLDVRPELRRGVVAESGLHTDPRLENESFFDVFGNASRRITAPAGPLRLTLSGDFLDSGKIDARCPTNRDAQVSEFPTDVLQFLMASRYCEVDSLSQFAWANFGGIIGARAKVEAICEFVHNHLKFDYLQARATRTAQEAMNERVGVCRDFAHLAIALCRAMSIPARYCNGYLGDIGVPPDPSPMDFSAWFEAYLDGSWYTYDPRHNERRIGRIVISRGRDATDTAMITSFGPHSLERFEVVTDEVRQAAVA
jgi:transglutaminase-like putative cysteine protease